MPACIAIIICGYQAQQCGADLFCVSNPGADEPARAVDKQYLLSERLLIQKRSARRFKTSLPASVLLYFIYFAGDSNGRD